MCQTKLYVGNLPKNCLVNDLQTLFEHYGKVEECNIVKKYGFVYMSTEEEAKTVIQVLNNFDFMGSKITVEISRSKLRPKPGMGRKGRCFRCGRQGHSIKKCPKIRNERYFSYRSHYFHRDETNKLISGYDKYVDRLYNKREIFGMKRLHRNPYEWKYSPYSSIPRVDYYYRYYGKSFENDRTSVSSYRQHNSSEYKKLDQYDFTDDPILE